jgi:ABC-type transport system involved in Fe-S cluster assembly fused permease/ATPase subunit
LYEFYFLTESSVPEDWPQEGHIHFEGISLRYDPEREPVITKIDLKIPAGQKVSAPTTYATVVHLTYCVLRFLFYYYYYFRWEFVVAQAVGNLH